MPLARIACDRGGVGEGAVLDRIDAGARRRLDAARAMGMGGDPEAERVRGGDDGAHLLVGEMGLEAGALLREDAAGGGELDHLRAVAGDARGPARRIGPRRCRCCGRTSAAITSGRKPETSPWPPMIEMAGPEATMRGPGNSPSRVPRESAKPTCGAGAEVAHRGEAGAQGGARVADADQHRIFVRVDRLVAIVAAGIAGEVDVHVDQARQHGAASTGRSGGRPAAPG